MSAPKLTTDTGHEGVGSSAGIVREYNPAVGCWTPASHAALVAEVTALRAILNDAVELVESLRADRDRLRSALKLCVARLDEYEDAKDGIALECANFELERTAPTARAALGRAAL